MRRFLNKWLPRVNEDIWDECVWILERYAHDWESWDDKRYNDNLDGLLGKFGDLADELTDYKESIYQYGFYSEYSGLEDEEFERVSMKLQNSIMKPEWKWI